MKSKCDRQFSLNYVHHQCLNIGWLCKPVMPLPIFIGIKSTTSISGLYSLIVLILFIILHLNKIWKLFENFLECFSLRSFHYSLLNLRICIVSMNAAIKMVKGFLFSHRTSGIFCIWIGKYDYVIPFELIYFDLKID